MTREELNIEWSEAGGKVDPNAVIAGGTALLGIFGGLYTSAQRKKAAEREAEAAAIIAAQQAQSKERRTRLITYSVLGGIVLIVGGVIVYKLAKR